VPLAPGAPCTVMHYAFLFAELPRAADEQTLAGVPRCRLNLIRTLIRHRKLTLKREWRKFFAVE